jgi:hypothetical protein
MDILTRYFDKKKTHMFFFPDVQLHQNAILDKSFWTWPIWLSLFYQVFLIEPPWQ